MARTGLMTALRLEVGGVDVEADVPACTAPGYGGEQDLGSRRDSLLSGDRIDLRSLAEEPPQPSGVVMYPDPANLGERNRPWMSFPDADQVLIMLSLVAQAEAVAAAAFALTPGEADLAARALALLSAPVGRKGTAEIDCSLLEQLRRNPLPPGKAGHLLGDGAVSGDDNTLPASSLLFQALKALMRSYPDHGTWPGGQFPSR
jgi:hypothetical protein